MAFELVHLFLKAAQPRHWAAEAKQFASELCLAVLLHWEFEAAELGHFHQVVEFVLPVSYHWAAKELQLVVEFVKEQEEEQQFARVEQQHWAAQAEAAWVAAG